MKAEQIDQALRQKFLDQKERLVFWHDQDGEFTDYIAEGLQGELSAVALVEPAKLGGLSTKLLLEQEKPKKQFLIYTTGAPRSAKEDWLYDIRLYSAKFHADIASIWLQELGLAQLSLHDHLKSRATFLNNKERRKKLAQMVVVKDDAAALDRKMIAVLVKATADTPFSILQAICHDHVEAGRYELSTEPDLLKSLEKMDLLESFWKMMVGLFDYKAEAPSISGLLRCLFYSELSSQLGPSLPTALQHYRLSTSGTSNALGFLSQWMDSKATAASHDAVALAIWCEGQLGELLSGLNLSTLEDVFTFWGVEKLVVSKVKGQLLDDALPVDAEAVAALVAKRRAGHWLAQPARDEDDRHCMAEAFCALAAAAELFALHAKHRHQLSFEEPKDLLLAYYSGLYQFDQSYRKFHLHAKHAQSKGWGLLKSLVDKVENVYDHGFLQPLGLAWSRLLDEGFLERWGVKELPPQQEFFKRVVQTHLDESSRKRAFVIISDALRYEAAQSLLEMLNGRDGMTAELSAQLGVLPSYTKLGMASLLPHRALSYKDNGEVLVDGQSTSSTEARDKILSAVEGMACQGESLSQMTSNQARDFTRDKRVVYIYHNVIDSRGDSASTESETFEAVSDCLREVTDLARFCFTKFNASKVWITADHGFLFQKEAPDLTDKSKLSQKTKRALTAKKRFVVGRDLGETPEAHHGELSTTAGVEGDIEFWVPRGTNRFHFSGGARFIHGGAMPQEVVVPVLTVTQLRGKKAESARVEKVGIQVLGTKHKITTPKYRFELLQLEAVSDRRKPITLKGAIYEGANLVSSVERITFDSQSENLEERKKPLKLELLSCEFDKSKPYDLVLRDAATEAEVQRVRVVIDRSFEDDF